MGIKGVDIEERYKLGYRAGQCLQADGRIKEAMKCFEECYRWRKSHFPEDHSNRLGSQHELAGAFRDNGQVKEAIKLLEHAVTVQEIILAKDHPDHALAGAHHDNGQVKEAVELLEHVIRIRKTTLAEDHPHRLGSQHALARAYEANRQGKEMVEPLEHVVTVQETKLTKDADQNAAH